MIAKGSLLACLGLIGGLIVSGSAAAAAPDLGEVEEFHAFPVYFAGEEVAGLPLEKVVGEDWREPRAQTWTFIYGDCEPRSDGGCSTPLQIQSQSTCKRWAAAQNQSQKLYGFKGAKARGGNGGRYEISPMEVFTGRATVVIWGYEKAIVKATARALRTVGASAIPPRLAAPVPGSLGGKLPCQKKPGFPDVDR